MKVLKKEKSWFWVCVLIVVIVVFIGGFTATKVFYLTKYKLDDEIKVDSYDNFIEKIRNKENKTISVNNNKTNTFIDSDGITIYGDFKDYNESVIPTSNGKRYDLFDNGNIIKYIRFAETQDNSPSYFGIIKAELSNVGNNSNYPYLSDKDGINKYLDNENIKNELDLFLYLSNTYDKKYGIFTKTNTMKYNFALHDASKNYFPNIIKLITIDGDYQGFIFQIEDNKFEMCLYKNDKTYYIEVFGFTSEEVYQLISNTILANK